MAIVDHSLSAFLTTLEVKTGYDMLMMLVFNPAGSYDADVAGGKHQWEKSCVALT